MDNSTSIDFLQGLAQLTAAAVEKVGDVAPKDAERSADFALAMLLAMQVSRCASRPPPRIGEADLALLEDAARLFDRLATEIEAEILGEFSPPH